ncbi:transketolase [Desulfuribacillus stibiiarsenatis]|uniref:Transketolase n=1 Tax=Desulfuribacillus stibiiarsenatis TaxID=1390249 RepID=A0A1E5L9P8_9FIRM|nr:transketolase [Desulfuribacillus stibiiarsenatis]OEH86778.1 transketolase [Desulfuribacillus stibiiarsenatis]
MQKEQLILIQEKARLIRQDICTMTCKAKSGHPGGSLSSADIVAYLYFHAMNVDPKNPKDPNRDRFVLSKGHASPVLYGALAEKGFFPREELLNFRKIGAMLQGHPEMKGTPGVDMSTGSLGQGLAAANGMALAGKLDKKDYRVFVVMGDGEIQEGMIWEAAMASAHYKLDNVTAFLDYNGLQIDGPTEEVMSLCDVAAKWQSFCWHTIEIDGHNIEEIHAAVEEAKTVKGKPTIIIAKTVKGKGVSYMENQVGWHGNAPSDEQLETALADLADIADFCGGAQ